VPQLRVTDLAKDADLSAAAAEDARDVLKDPNHMDNCSVYQRIEAYINSVDVGAVA
jgi:hypothetical protein